MALLQQGAVCLRGLAPLSRSLASASKRSAHQTLKCTSLLSKGSFEGDSQNGGTGRDMQLVPPSGDTLLASKSAFDRQVASVSTYSSSSVIRETSVNADLRARSQTETESEISHVPTRSVMQKSITDIYGPYEPPSGTQGGTSVEFSGATQDGAGASSTELQNSGGGPPGQVDSIAEEFHSTPVVVELDNFASSLKRASLSAPEVGEATASTSGQMIDSPIGGRLLPERSTLEVNAPSNLTFSVGDAAPLPGPSNSGNGAYAAFSAFAVIPLLFVLVVSWLTYSSYRSKRRPLEIRVGWQNSSQSGGLETGNGRPKQKQSSTLIQQIVERLPQLKEEYKPYPGLTNRHVETIFAAFFRKLPNVRFRRECLAAPDGGTVALDWPVHGGKRESDDAMWGQELPAGAPVLILLPGLTGGSEDTYVRHMLVRARRAGFHTVVFNSRGCADSPVTSPQFYSASFTDDMRLVSAHVQRRFPDSKLLAMGWSLGANILVRYLGQEGSRTPIAAAASLCNPFDLVKGDEGFRTGFGKVYDRSLANSLNRIFSKHASLFEGIGGDYNIPLVARAKTVRDFDEGLTRVCFGFPSVDEYYRQSSSINNIQDVAIPLMCIQAEDDPIAPNEGIPREKIEANPNTFLVVTPAGGHLGWIAGEEAPLGAPWTDPVVMDFFKAFLELQPSGPRDTPKAEREVRKTLQEVENPGDEALEVSRSWNKR